MQVYDELGQLQVSTGVGAGDISGPAVSTDNAIARWDGAGGDILQNSGVLIDDSDILQIPEYLAHLGDPDTYLRFTDDRLRVVVGGVDILDIMEIAGQDTIVWNEGGVDVDFRWEGVGVADALFIQGSDGAVTLGGPLLTLTGGQINFPVAQAPSADVHTLDDYEEGTWTPAITFGGAAVGVTYAGSNQGRYTKIGRLVVITGSLILTDKGSSNGNALITGLPFVVGQAAGVHLATYKLSFADYPYGQAFDTSMVLYEVSNAGLRTNLTDANFDDDTNIIVTFVYFV